MTLHYGYASRDQVRILALIFLWLRPTSTTVAFNSMALGVLQPRTGQTIGVRTLVFLYSYLYAFLTANQTAHGSFSLCIF